MKKKSLIILLALTMILMVFSVACGDKSKAPSDTAEDSRQLDDDGDDVEAARGSDTSDQYNFDNVTFDDWQNMSEPDDASFRGSSIDKDSLAIKDGN